MQSQIHSYPFQLNEEGQNSFLASHPKQKLFIIGASLPQSTSYLHLMKYDEENPRKSAILTKKIQGQAFKAVPFCKQNSDTLLIASKRNQNYIISQIEYGYFDEQEQKGMTDVFTSNSRINDIILKKNSEEAYLSQDDSISVMDTTTWEVKEKIVESEHKISHCLVDPIHDYLTYATNSDTIVVCHKKNNKYFWDYQRQNFIIKASKDNSPKITALDYNPNKQYYLMSAHHGCLKFWDIRKGNVPVKTVSDHHSLVIDAKYNHSHDELITCSYDDGSVGLFRISSVSSAPAGEAEDSLIKLYDEHEDSVYRLCWTSFSPWIFLSLTYNASNVVVNLVPSVEKYRILL